MNKHLLIRRSHRYLGVFLGIQFFFWTISGLYFSWNNLDSVHGDHMRKSPRAIHPGVSVVPPGTILTELETHSRPDSIRSISLISLAGKPLYQILYYSGSHGEHGPALRIALADAQTGKVRGPLDKEEAVELAKDHLVSGTVISDITYLSETDGHHEYREQPLPAWQISFSKPACTVYISADRGTFQSVRHTQWRIFDFLWMFHTMDYRSRDDINNWTLRIFSVFGLVTVLSGFALFIVSSRRSKSPR